MPLNYIEFGGPDRKILENRRFYAVNNPGCSGSAGNRAQKRGLWPHLDKTGGFQRGGNGTPLAHDLACKV